MGQRGQNPDIIDELISYDRPDIILCKDNVPVLVLEKTTEVPTGHNIGQRMGRIVKAAEMGVPVIKFLPFDARKHGEYSSMCNLNIRLLDAFIKISKIHGVPVIAMNWISDENGELVRDGSQDFELAKLVDSYFKSDCKKHIPDFDRQIKIMQKEWRTRLAIKKSYALPPPSVLILKTSEFVKRYHISGVSRGIRLRSKTLVYKMDMSPDKCRREDPYTGMQFIYDYQYCRIGKGTEEKGVNLVLHIPQVTVDEWMQANPDDQQRKSCLWYKTANLIILKDGIIQLR